MIYRLLADHVTFLLRTWSRHHQHGTETSYHGRPHRSNMGGFHILHQVPRPHTSRVVSTFLNVFSLSCWNLLLSLHPGVSLTFQHRKRKVISTAEVGSARSSLLHSVYMDMCLSLRITSVEWSCGHEYVRKGQDTYKSRPYDAFFAIGHPCLVNQ